MNLILFIAWLGNFVIPITINSITYHDNNQSAPVENTFKNDRVNVVDLKIKTKTADPNKELKIDKHRKKGQTSISSCSHQLKVGCIDPLVMYSVSKEFKSSKGAWFKVLIDLLGTSVNLTLKREKDHRIFVNLSQINKKQTNFYFKNGDKVHGKSTNVTRPHTSSKTHNKHVDVSDTTYSHNSDKSNSIDEITNANHTIDSKKIIIKNIYTGHLDAYRNSHFHGSYTSKQGLKGILESQGVMYKFTPTTINNNSQVELGYQTVDVEVMMIDQADWAYDWEEEEVRRIRDARVSRKRQKNKKLSKKEERIVIRKQVNADGDNLKIMSNISAEDSHKQAKRMRKNRAKRYIKYDLRTHRVCTINYRVSINYYTDICQNSIQVCIDRALWILEFVNRFFRRTDFNFDGQSDNIGFVLTNFAVIDHYDEESDSLKMLLKFSRERHPPACMNILMVNHALNEGVLGLAYIPKLQRSSGGICYGIDRINSIHNNALLTSERSLEGSVAIRHVAITIMHELGHAFGAPHDVLGRCTAYRFEILTILFNVNMYIIIYIYI